MDATQPAQGQVTGKGKILVISLEMPASQILDRLVAKQANVSLRTLAEGVRNEGDFRRVATAISNLARTGLVVRDDLYDLASICATARAMAKSGGLEAIVVD